MQNTFIIYFYITIDISLATSGRVSLLVLLTRGCYCQAAAA